ncbi:MAG: class I SAM-dependent methyltransferase [Deltaproteobacteria bacterium]|nr:class I SAM-dependent methyltransferase [Deltaproteobacteria bacterium]
MSDSPKSFALGPEVHAYLVAHGSPPDAIKQSLMEETSKLGGISMMQIAPEQGAFMNLLARLMGARRMIEVGTFTGYSALCLAEALPDDGELICCDVSEEWTSIGVPFWEKAGVRERIRLEIAPALETLRALPRERSFDLAFIDADKPSYSDYYDELLQLIRPGGVILVDNVLWFGRVADPDVVDEHTEIIREFNTKLACDERVECVMLPLADGLTLARVR